MVTFGLILKKFNRESSINGWSDEEIIECLPLYFEGTLTLYDNNESNLINETKLKIK